MTDYSNGKIYKITSVLRPDLIYIGSTVWKLWKRMSSHRAKTNKSSSRQILELGDAVIELIHDFPCNSKEELRIEEQRVMNTFPVIVNQHDAYLSDEDRIAKDKQRMKIYRKTHKEELAEYNKKWREENQESLLEKQRKWNEINKVEIAAKRSQRYTCECGYECTYKNKSRHIKSQNHLALINSKSQIN